MSYEGSELDGRDLNAPSPRALWEITELGPENICWKEKKKEMTEIKLSEFNYCSRSIHKAVYMGQLILCPFAVCI